MSIFNNLLTKHHFKILWLLILLYIIVFGTICLWKYSQLGYNSIDLAIINQTFYNSVEGNFFASSIHYPSYLGDHFTPLLLLLLPLYLLYQSPITLLILQTIFLALAAWPLYLITKNFFKQPIYYLLLPLLFLLNPLVHNANTFEFHFLPFCYFFIFFAFYFYQKNKFWPCLAFISLALMIREDISLFIICFGLFILIEQLLKKKKLAGYWFLTLIVLGLGYFFVSLKIISHFNTAASYKFLIYYNWLGESFPEVIKNIIFQPGKIFIHFFKEGNLDLILGLLMPLAFLPLLKPHYLILALGTFLQLTLSNLGANTLVFQTHYATLLIIPLFLALIEVFYYLKQKPKLQVYQKVIIPVLLVATLYSIFFLGFKPLKAEQPELLAVKKEFLTKIPTTASLITSYEFLTPLSSRPQIYSLNYSFLGKKQYSTQAYQLSADVDYILADLAETITYQMQYEGLKFYQADYYQGANNLRKLIEDNNFGLVEIKDTIAIFKKDSPPNYQLYTLETSTPQNIFHCQQGDQSNSFLLLSCQVQFDNKPTDNYQLELEIKKDGKIISSRLLPLAYGFYQTRELEPDQLLTTNYQLLTPPATAHQICLHLVKLQGALGINARRSIFNFITQKEIVDSSCLNL